MTIPTAFLRLAGLTLSALLLLLPAVASGAVPEWAAKQPEVRGALVAVAASLVQVSSYCGGDESQGSAKVMAFIDAYVDQPGRAAGSEKNPEALRLELWEHFFGQLRTARGQERPRNPDGADSVTCKRTRNMLQLKYQQMEELLPSRAPAGQMSQLHLTVLIQLDDLAISLGQTRFACADDESRPGRAQAMAFIAAYAESPRDDLATKSPGAMKAELGEYFSAQLNAAMAQYQLRDPADDDENQYTTLCKSARDETQKLYQQMDQMFPR